MINQEVVNEEDATDFSKSINASFCSTSAFLNKGVDKLFRMLGHRYLAMFLGEKDPNEYMDESAANKKHSVKKKEDKAAKKKGYVLNQESHVKRKKKFC